MKLPITAHTERPWRIHEIAADFRVLDVWALPTPGGADDFSRLVQIIAAFDPSQSPSVAVRSLFAARWKLGELLGWDRPTVDDAASSLRQRVPADLRDAPTGPYPDTLPFVPVYLLEDEWAVEVSDRTVHGVLHLGWVQDSAAGYRAQMAILVKPRGLLGRGYLHLIQPFRHTLVFPGLRREIGVAWRAQASAR